jgi:acyl-CoA synthetase (NDP forming)
MATAGGATRSSIERLLNPRSIALAGVSANRSSLAGGVLDNLERYGYGGEIHLIHPKEAEIRGRKTVQSPMDLPEGVDCVVLGIPVAGILDAVKACAARGVGGVVIFSAGFAELGPEGRQLQEEIARVAKEAGMAMEGPNCLGFVNYVKGVPGTFGNVPLRPLAKSGVAVVSQSGAMASVLRVAMHSHEIDVTISVSTGNEAANGIEDFLEYMLEQPETKLVAMVLEHIRHPQRFLSLARTARERNIPIVLMHPGRSVGAAQAAATHTGALTGDHDVMTTLVRREGVLMVETLEELIDIADILVRCPKRPFGGVAVLGESGAFKAMTLDYCELLGLDLPQPEGEHADAINAIAPGLIIASNPIDLTAQALVDPSLYGRSIGALMANPRCGSLLVAIILTGAEMAKRKMPPVIEVMREWAPKQTTMFTLIGQDTKIPQEIITEVREAGVPFFRSFERALRAIATLTKWSETAPSPGKLEVARGERIAAGVIPEFRSKDLLEKAGLPFGKRGMAKTLDEAKKVAAEIGYPVCLKIQSTELSHKSDIGGVILGLGDESALQQGWERLDGNVKANAPDAPIDGVLVEKMAKPGLELILGARNDPEWGPVIVVGLGGVMAEALKDVRLVAPDLSPDEIVRELKKLKGAALLESFRGKPARDVKAIAEAVSALGRFMLAHPEVRELDVNPLLAFAEGEGVLALDALMSCD